MRKPIINQEVYDLYDDYAHNVIERREFMDRMKKYTVGGMTLPTLLGFIMPNYQDNIQIPEDDPRLITRIIEYQSPNGGGAIKAQISKPKNARGRIPGIVVVHENRGLNPHIADVGRRAALAGFVSLSPDALTPLGGYPGNDDDGRVLQRDRDREEMLEDFIAAFHYLQDHEDCNGKVGVVGFCFGGWISNMMAVKVSELRASVPFYGGQPDEEEVSQIKSPLQLHYAGLDKRVNAGWADYENALKANNIDYKAYIYPNTNHGFHNNTTVRFDPEAAELAWKRTIDFFKEKLN
ncbi:MAG TPA: dienelactone hydrolase family protein [Cyclobacteriaceae bacterium]